MCHDGFQQAAARLDQLLRDDVLAALETHPGFVLRLSGHSLGAGVATLLALRWARGPYQLTMGGGAGGGGGGGGGAKSTPVKVHCYAYAPPCTLDLQTARDAADVVISVVVGE